MPLYVLQHGYYDEKSTITILEGPVGADMAALHAAWLATTDQSFPMSKWPDFLEWLLARDGWSEREYNDYNLEDGADNGVDGPIAVTDQWGHNPSDGWPTAFDAEQCPNVPLRHWMHTPPRHYYIRARLTDGSMIWRCRTCPKTIPAPIVWEQPPILPVPV